MEECSSSAPNEPDCRQHSFLLDLEGVDERSRLAFLAFLQAARLHRRLMAETMAEHGTHPGQAMCLRALAQRDGVVQRDLAGLLHLSPPTVSKMLRGMEQAKLVERRPDDHDQRLARVFLTDHGRALAGRLGGVAAEHVNRTIGGLPPGDLDELIRLLDALSARIAGVLEGRGRLSDRGDQRELSP